MYLHAESVTVDSDEGRLVLEIESAEEDRITVEIHGIDLDAFYNQVKGRIGPYLHERDHARATYRPEVFVCDDPEGSWIRDIALGAMDVSESLEGAAAALDAIDLRRKAEKES